MAGESAREVAKKSREKAERLMRHAELYELGAKGEERTAALLRGLPPGWTVLHDVRWPGRRLANIDHVVIGPSGIFVIDSKNWSGRVDVRGGTLRQNGRSRETAVVSCADSALAIGELVPGVAKYVVPVLCFVREEPVQGSVRSVLVCSSGNLLQMLVTRPARMTPEQTRDAFRQLDTMLREATKPASSVRQLYVQRPERWRIKGPAGRVRSRRKTKEPSLARLVLSLALVLAFLAVGPQLAAEFSKVFVHVVTSNQGPRPCDGTSTEAGSDC